LNNRSQYTIALAGNPNSGKTSIFNRMTGSNQTTGNWPGVTVERKEGRFQIDGKSITVIDLPGIYSLTSYSPDEKVARDFLLEREPDMVVVVVDASNIERNLYLVLQLLELGQKVVIALNMMDMAEKNGVQIDHLSLAQQLQIRVVPTIGSRGEGIAQLKEAIVQRLELPVAPPPSYYGQEIEEALGEVQQLLEQEENCTCPTRFMAVKLAEEDPEFLARLDKMSGRELIMSAYEQFTSDESDLSVMLAEKRYGYIHGLCRECLKQRSGFSARVSFSDKVDSVATNRWLGIPVFVFFMWLSFQLIFSLGNPVADMIGMAIDGINSGLQSALPNVGFNPWLTSLLTDGIITGVGAILVFVPNIFILFTVFALLGETGYMSRAAFVMDRLMHLLGLHGKSFIPMLLGFGCNVPAIMATRTLESRKDRILTILVNPLMSCSARLPVYILFTGIFFREHQGAVVLSLYLMGILLAILMARLFKWMFFREETAPLIMELPPYQIPDWRHVFRQAWIRTWMFLRKAGTVIVGGVILIWLLASLPAGVEYASSGSWIGRLGAFLAPALQPAGFGSWQAAVTLIFGIVAKEVMIGTLETLQVTGETLRLFFTPLSAYAFMVMALIYIPCFATIAVIRKEAGLRWAVLGTIYPLILGWVMAVLVYQVGGLFIG
jgi:ferrous iron transport protein B